MIEEERGGGVCVEREEGCVVCWFWCCDMTCDWLLVLEWMEKT